MRINIKLKTLLMLPILLISTLVVLGVPSVRPAYAIPQLSVSPAVITDTCPSACTLYGVGSTFQYSVRATGIAVGQLFAYQFSLHFNPQILQAVNGSISYGACFDLLVSGGNAVPVTSIDNFNGVVFIAVASFGPQCPLFATTNLVLGVITFSVAGLGRSDQSIQDNILIHDAGGGVQVNIPTTTKGAVFSNIGLFGRADLPTPCTSTSPPGCPRQAFPESVLYSIAQDNSFTPGIEDLFANVNSTGTLPVVVFIRFTLTSDFGTFVRNTSTHQYDPGEVSVVAQFTGYNPNPTGTFVQVGTFDVLAQVFYRQVNLDNTLGPLTAGESIKPFHFTVIPALPTTTTVSCSPTSVQLSSLCTAVVSSSDPVTKLTGSVGFASSVTGVFKPASCTVTKGVCSVSFFPKSMGSATVTASYSGDLTGSGGHTGSSGTTTVTVIGHSTSTIVNCSPGTVNAPNQTSTTCTATVTDTSGTPVTPSGTVSFKSSKLGTFSPTSCSLSAGSCFVTYTPGKKSTALGKATITASYSGDTVGDGHLISSGTTSVTVTGHATTTTLSCTPSTLGQFTTTTCTVKVTDTSSTPVTPTGTVSFSSSKHGIFTPGGSCTLSPISTKTATCTVTFEPTSTGSYTITAVYSGDHIGDGHLKSSKTATLTVS